MRREASNRPLDIVRTKADLSNTAQFWWWSLLDLSVPPALCVRDGIFLVTFCDCDFLRDDRLGNRIKVTQVWKIAKSLPYLILIKAHRRLWKINATNCLYTINSLRLLNACNIPRPKFSKLRDENTTALGLDSQSILSKFSCLWTKEGALSVPKPAHVISRSDNVGSLGTLCSRGYSCFQRFA